MLLVRFLAANFSELTSSDELLRVRELSGQGREGVGWQEIGRALKWGSGHLKVLGDWPRSNWPHLNQS